MYIILFIIFFKHLLFGAREGGQTRPDYNIMSYLTRLCDRHKSVDTVSAGFVFVRAEELCPVAYVNIKLD